MAVAVDPARQDELARGVDLGRARRQPSPDRYHLLAPDGKVGLEDVVGGGDRAATDDEVMVVHGDSPGPGIGV